MLVAPAAARFSQLVMSSFEVTGTTLVAAWETLSTPGERQAALGSRSDSIASYDFNREIGAFPALLLGPV
jgi:hypothetical protein